MEEFGCCGYLLSQRYHSKINNHTLDSQFVFHLDVNLCAIGSWRMDVKHVYVRNHRSIEIASRL
jgi:hypothetical protein